MKLKVLIVLTLACAALAPSAQATYAGDAGKLAFEFFDETTGSGWHIGTVNPDGSGFEVLQPLHHTTQGKDPAWSPDGQQLAFTFGAIWVMNADGSESRRITQRGDMRSPTWSPDGEEIAFVWNEDSGCNSLVITRLDGTETRRVIEGAGLNCFIEDAEWSPTGSTIVFRSGNGQLYRVEADGSGLAQLTSEDTGYGGAGDPDWAPDGSSIVYDVQTSNGAPQYDVYSIKPDGTQRTHLFAGQEPVWSPDRAEIAFIDDDRPSGGGAGIEASFTDYGGSRPIYSDNNRKEDLDWQRLPATPKGYPRPKFAAYLELSLVPAQYQCLEPDREHGPSLSFPSCNPPVPYSDYLTVGTPDANGQPALFRGFLHFRSVVGDPSTPADESDVSISATLPDIRCRTAIAPCAAGALSDYTGQMQARFSVRITDKHNALGHPITVQDVPLSVPIPCVVTPTAPGSNCETTTTMEAVVPGVVPEGKRSTWQIDQVTIYDGGADGDPSSGIRTPFAVTGVFVP